VKARVLAPVVAPVVAADVVAALVPAAVVVVVALAVAAAAAAGDSGVGAGTNEIGTVCDLPPPSPKASVQLSPAAIWAAVGGQGYLAASVAGLPPPLSVVGQVVIR
jgi:hypothetical protein